MAVLLIGSTGNGKSTLGNFLIDPDRERRDVAFEVATDNRPFTQETKVVIAPLAVASYEGETITIIDTPGLNENKKKDLRHMTDLIKSLNTLREKKIRACIFVVKFQSKLDQQYKDTVRYYADLLPSLFSRNVFLVMTHYATDERSVKMREVQRVNEEAIVDNVKAEIRESAKINFDPMVFAIDCVPIFNEEKATSSEMRQCILSYIASQEAVSIEDLRVAKTKGIAEDDERKKKEKQGRIKGYNFRLQEVHKDAKAALDDVEKRKGEISELQISMASTKQRLAEINTDKEIVGATDSVDCGWKFLQWQSYDFHLECNSDISSVKKWKRDNNEWKGYSEGRRSVSVSLEGNFCRGLAGQVTLYTKTKWVHQTEVSQLQSAMSLKECDLRFAEKDMERSRKDHEKHKELIATLERFIDEINKDIAELAVNTMTLEEAERRINELPVQGDP